MDETNGERAMEPLHPNQVWVLRIRAAITALIVTFAALLLDMGPLRATTLPAGLAPGAVALLMAAIVLVLPTRRYRAWGYRETDDELHVRSGLLFQARTVVPFGRVQHIDVAHGPLERRFGLATLILHTAGTRGASVSLPGLAEGHAEAMRDRIRARIRQDLL